MPTVADDSRKLKLIIGPKNYSSWSMRPWVLMRALDIPFEEESLRFDSFEPGSGFKTRMAQYTPTGCVPVLVDPAHDDFAVWDSLAITEYLAERFPQSGVWPAGSLARARARSLCAEMHSGLGSLREALAMNIEARLPEVGARRLREDTGVARNVARVLDIWTRALETHGGPFLFGGFSAADAFFAPVCTRFTTYAISLPPTCQAYLERVLATPAVAAWIDGALREHQFVPFEEPYRTQR